MRKQTNYCHYDKQWLDEIATSMHIGFGILEFCINATEDGNVETAQGRTYESFDYGTIDIEKFRKVKSCIYDAMNIIDAINTTPKLQKALNAACEEKDKK